MLSLTFNTMTVVHLMITNHPTKPSRSLISRDLRAHRSKSLVALILIMWSSVSSLTLLYALSYAVSYALPSYSFQETFAQAPLQDRSRERTLEPPRLTTRFNARVVQWDPTAQALRVRDQVKLVQGELSVTCASAMVEFRGVESESAGQVSKQLAQHASLGALTLKRIHAHGQVRVRFRNLHLSASAIDYDHINKTLEVTGPISGRWGRARLRGTHLTLSLATRTAQAEQVEVSVPLPQLIPQSVRDLDSKRSINAWRSR